MKETSAQTYTQALTTKTDLINDYQDIVQKIVFITKFSISHFYVPLSIQVVNCLGNEIFVRTTVQYTRTSSI